MATSQLLEVQAESATALDGGQLRRISNIVLWAAVLTVATYHLVLHVKTLTLDEPMGSWETVYANIARVWPHQYQWEHHVAGHDGYGPGYPTFVRPFLATGLDVYVAHRLAGLMALAAAVAMLVWQLRSRSIPPVIVAVFAAVFYAVNAGTYSIQARPDFLVLLEIAALLAAGDAVVRGRLRLGLGFGVGFGALALAAFFTKAYAIFTAVAVLGYLIVFVNWRRAIAAAVIAVAIVALGVWAYAAANPLYVLEVFRGQVVQAEPSFNWFLHQAGDFGLLTCGLFVAAISLIAARLLARPARSPLSAEAKFWRWQLAAAVGALTVGPGWHTGAYLTYFLHLALLPLVFVAAEAVERAQPRWQAGLDGAFLANLAVLMLTAPAWPRSDPEWDKLKRAVRAEPGRVAVDYLLEPVARAKPGTIVVSTGQTGYVLQEPFLMSDRSRVVQAARAAADEYFAQQRRTLFGDSPVDAIYLDCVVRHRVGDNAGGYSLTPRNGLPYFQGPEMNGYVATHIYRITPYYFATNARRQTAGTQQTAIVRFVRKTAEMRTDVPLNPP